MNWQSLLKKYGIIATIVSILGISGYLKGLTPVFAYELDEVIKLAQSNSDAIALQRWQYLNTKKINQGLDTAEQLEYCKLSKRLGLFGQGCI